MKTMTCKQLAGACDQPFSANSFEEIAKKSQQHGKEMFQQGDQAHLDAMNNMGKFTSEEMKIWLEQKKEEFDSLPEDN
ncbi:DUF1059 domain-containing protein [Planococcus donghaensis]|uniref:DUF1059 domain-containing protein n=1 Tax=Planococcus donghaensis TaxID=414778 RepID=A0A1C7EE43_9BACL|nr:DUF1059 domain-containing protein [Planococcus donghaensis]ANU22140.1 DUF1059 domain-containing protein [Planococcus donghaensis]